MIISVFLLFKTDVFATDTARTLVGDYFNQVFGIKLTDGSSALENLKDVRTSQESLSFESDDLNIDSFRKSLNNKIYSNSASKASLYDRFGPDIKFIPYYGETRIMTKMYDKFYSSIVENNLKFTIDWDLIKQLLKKSSTSNNIIYTGRPDIISTEQMEDGYVDPRVECYSGVNTIGGDAALGNILLTISNIFCQITSWMSSNGLFNLFNELVKMMFDAIGVELLSNLSKVLIVLAVAFSLIFMVTKIIKIFKGDFSVVKFFETLLSLLVSLGLFYTITDDPMILSNGMDAIVNAIDSVFDDSLNDGLSDDLGAEVICGTDSTNTRSAILWERVVFDPWCQGMFQDKYSNLYTMYESNATSKGGNCLKQDEDFIIDTGNTLAEPRYNSKEITGDVKVPIGGNEYVRNWAALAYSCQSLYHINAIDDEESYIASITEKGFKDDWPRAYTCPYNSNIYVDNFRWLDAKLNISPEFYSTEKVVYNYSNSNEYQQTFIKSGFTAIYRAILLIPILLVAIRKTKYIIILIFSGIRLWYASLMNFFNHEKYNVLSNLKNVISPLYDYLWWSMVCFIDIILYHKLVGDNTLKDIIFIIMAIYFYKLKPLKNLRQIQEIKDGVKNKVGKAASKISSKALSKFSK